MVLQRSSRLCIVNNSFDECQRNSHIVSQAHASWHPVSATSVLLQTSPVTSARGSNTRWLISGRHLCGYYSKVSNTRKIQLVISTDSGAKLVPPAKQQVTFAEIRSIDNASDQPGLMSETLLQLARRVVPHELARRVGGVGERIDHECREDQQVDEEVRPSACESMARLFLWLTPRSG